MIFMTVLLLLAGGSSAQTEANTDADSPRLHAGLVLGYFSGFEIQGNFTVSNFAQGFPLSARVGIGYTMLDPGTATDARRIFINNATNGIPEEKGRMWDFRMDLMYPVKLFNMERAYLTFGPRHSRFKANFKYVGGNEDFDVTSNQWGLGTGIEGYFPMSKRVDFTLSGGIDYFLKARLAGHDTSYDPNGDDINPREEYTFDDADKAIGQPKFEFRVMLGFSYGL